MASAGAFEVEAYHCDPATAMLWPTHFNSMGKLTINETIAAKGGSVRVGPFSWTPHIVGHECLVAIVRGVSDPTIADSVSGKGPVDHWKLVRFDNNVGQRNVEPQKTVPGGKTNTSFLVRGNLHKSVNTLRLDASTLPSDTKILVRVARSITSHAEKVSGFAVASQNDRWSVLRLPGGSMGMIENFPLAANEEKSVALEIDFSFEAEHLHRYPIVASQVQNGVLAGQLTIEITAVKESEDYLYGNARTQELHTLHCPFREQMSPHNHVPFATLKDALARGYNGCAFCLPQYSTD
jgi:hypothetical protein